MSHTAPAALSGDPSARRNPQTSQSKSEGLLEAALAYAERDWRVLPLRPRGKAPMTNHGVKDATTDPGVIRKWWALWPDANVGIACGAGLCVLDVDPRNDGDASLRRLEQEHGPITTLRARTGGGGEHLFLTGDLRPRTGFRPGLDLKGAGGYVVAPPSIHPNGSRYTWSNDKPALGTPAWLRDIVGACTEKEHRPQADLAAPSIEELVDLVRALPNPPEADRGRWVEVAIGIKAAGAEDEEAAREAFMEWASRHESHDPDNDEQVWGTISAPFRLGWAFLLERATEWGLNSAPYEFAPVSEAAVADSTTPRLRFKFRSDVEMEQLLPPEPLIGNKLTRGGLSALVGPPGSGKTFVALDWACSVAAGVPSCGDAVLRGPVVYVAAEGSAGIGVRLRAWKQAHGITAPLGVHFLSEPVNLLTSKDVEDFLEAVTALPAPPVFIVLDTLARCMTSGDENSTAEMGAFIAGADRVRRATGAHILFQHHPNKSGDSERGSSSLRGAVDTLVFVRKEGDLITLTCEKQKDAPPFPAARLALVQVGASCAVEAASPLLQQETDALPEKQLIALDVFRRFAPSHGLTSTEWMKLSRLADRTFYAARKALVAKGFVTEPPRGRGGRYVITTEGEELLTASLQGGCKEPALQHRSLTAAGAGGLEETPALQYDRAPSTVDLSDLTGTSDAGLDTEDWA